MSCGDVKLTYWPLASIGEKKQSEHKNPLVIFPFPKHIENVWCRPISSQAWKAGAKDLSGALFAEQEFAANLEDTLRQHLLIEVLELS